MDRDVQKGLEQDAQVIKERLPKNPTQEDYQRVAESLRTFIEKNNYSQAQVARWIGYSPTVISEFLSGRYSGSYERIANKIINLINGVCRKQDRVKPGPFIHTAVATRIGTLITMVDSFCDDEGKIGLIIGDGGHGKSHCLRLYAQANLNSIYVELDNTMGSVAIFAEVAKKLKLDSTGSLAGISRRLIESLRERHIIIMMDEASALTIKQLNQLRQIIVVKSRCPLILAGNKQLLETAMQPTTKRGCESLDQFVSRLAQVLNLDELATDEDGGLYTPEDVLNLYQYGGIRLMPQAVETIRQICRTPKSGRLRTCGIIIAALHTSSVVAKKGYINSAMILSAIKQLDLPIKVRLPVNTLDIQEEDAIQESVVAAG